MKDVSAAAGRREFGAVSADGLAGYRIPDTSAGRKSAGDLLEFLIAQKASANTAKHTVCFHKYCSFLIYQKVIISGDEPGDERRVDENPATNSIMKPGVFNAPMKHFATTQCKALGRTDARC